jgi:hypothetical protein
MAVSNEELAQIIGELEARTGNNRMLEDALIDEARDDPNHRLYEYFTRDATEALLKLNRIEAQKLIVKARSVAQHPITQREIKVPAFIRQPFAPSGTYVPITRLRDDLDTAREALRREYNRVTTALERAEKIASVIPGAADVIAVERERVAATLRRLANPSPPTAAAAE